MCINYFSCFKTSLQNEQKSVHYILEITDLFSKFNEKYRYFY